MSTLGEKIKARRKELRWTLRELGERSDLTASFLCDVERDLRGIGVDSLLRLSNALGIPVDQLMSRGSRQTPAEIVQLPARLQQWAYDADVPYRHAACLYWCARTVVDHQPSHRKGTLDEWDWAKFCEALKPWMEG